MHPVISMPIVHFSQYGEGEPVTYSSSDVHPADT